MGTFSNDLRYGARMLAKSPGFTIVALLSLALGIGGNATVFSWVQAVLLHPLAGVQDSDRLLAVESIMANGSYHTSSFPDYRDYRDHNTVFSGLIGFELIEQNLKLHATDQPQRVVGEIATENYFDVLGVNASRGRTFHASDDHGPVSDPYIVLSDGMWKRQFGGDPNVVGKSVEINQHPFTVIGVTPRGFSGTIVGIMADYWVPMMMQPQALPGEDLNSRNPTFVHIAGRLKPGVTPDAARAELKTVARRLEQEYPITTRNIGIDVAPIWKAHYGLQSILLPVLVFLSGVVLLVLLIACANVANLLLARATVREKEIAIRAAMGASRSRLVRQMLAESLLLALGGGVLGALMAAWTSGGLTLFFPPTHLPVGVATSMDWRVLSFIVMLSIATGVLFGIVPALRGSRTQVNDSLKEGGRTSAGGSGQPRLRNLLVLSETVLAVVLLVGAGLMVRTLQVAQSTSPGFNTDRVLLGAMDLRANGYSRTQSGAFYSQLLDKLKTVPGVRSATLELWAPLWFTGRGYTLPDIEGYTPKPDEDRAIDYNVVGPNYFSATEIPLLAGREFTQADGDPAPRVCIVNRTMAQHYWPGESAIGHRLNSWDTWWTVAGVVQDIHYHSMNEQPESFAYFPFLQMPQTDANILVRTEGKPEALLGAFRSQVHDLNPNVPILESDNLANLLSISLFAYRTAATLGALLGGIGLVLASIGIFGVLSYSVNQRTQEIGVRMALGARPADILRLVVGQGMRLVLGGMAVGIIAAIIAGQLISNLLYGVKATDPITFAGTAVILSTVAMLACALPARRAMLVDPMVALRYQ
jgi:macrolide transport system ATP-binding/permease protein